LKELPVAVRMAPPAALKRPAGARTKKRGRAVGAFPFHGLAAVARVHAAPPGLTALLLRPGACPDPSGSLAVKNCFFVKCEMFRPAIRPSDFGFDSSFATSDFVIFPPPIPPPRSLRSPWQRSSPGGLAPPGGYGGQVGFRHFRQPLRGRG